MPDECGRIENALRFTKIKKDWDIPGWKDLKDRGDDWSDNVGR